MFLPKSEMSRQEVTLREALEMNKNELTVVGIDVGCSVGSFWGQEERREKVVFAKVRCLDKKSHYERH